MRIISKFKDYYDNAHGYDSESEPLYLREMRICHKNVWPCGLKPFPELSEKAKRLISFVEKMPRGPRSLNLLLDRQIHSFDRGVVFFCGKSYPLYSVSTHHFETSSLDYKKQKHFYRKSPDELLPVLQSEDFQSCFSRGYWDKTLAALQEYSLPNKKHHYWMCEYAFSKADYARWVSDLERIPDLDEIHRELRVPVFSIFFRNYLQGELELILNPCLQDLQFVRYFEPYLAYQELEMYLYNVLTTHEDPTTHRTQEEIRDSKGFDALSFKMASPGKKAKRRKRKHKRRM